VTRRPPAPQVGERSESRTFGPITRTDIATYSAASGDANRIHFDDEFARAAGFPSVFAMGMLQAGLLGTFATDWLGAEQIRGFAVRLVDQVWPGDVLVCYGEVTAVGAVGAAGAVGGVGGVNGAGGGRRGEGPVRVDVALECRASDGRLVLTGSAAFDL
jgi:acyl dehydratase